VTSRRPPHRTIHSRTGRDGRSKQAIIDFVEAVTDESSPSFVPVAINHFIGKRPIATFGNSDGDRQMLEWTGAGDGKRLMMLVFHDDAEREYAYGPANGLPDTKFGTFSQNLMEEARDKGWHVISVKNDWKRIFASAP
jgi:hypothetical protein